MLDMVEKWGDSVEIAVDLALKDMKLSRDEVDVIVLEQPTRGFLGFHKKLAKVRVVRKEEPEKEEKTASVLQKAPEEIKVKEPPVKPEVKPEKKKQPEEPKREETEKAETGSRFFGENTYVMSDPYNNAEDDSENDDSEEEDLIIREEVVKPVRRRRNDHRKGSGSPVVHMKFTVTEEDEDAVPADHSAAAGFVRKIIDQMGLSEVEVKAFLLDSVLYISLTGKEVGALIGKRGKTLDSLQYLASIVENKGAEKYTRVLVNAENYREKREKTLQQLAKKVADKCAKSGRNQRLEPMNPYERKVIHSTLQFDSRVTTRSEGSEPSRRVVIEVKK